MLHFTTDLVLAKAITPIGRAQFLSPGDIHCAQVKFKAI